jgi:uncharacterized protein YgiM (DUF1202 family)
LRSGFVLAIVALAAFGLLDNAGNANAQSTGATTTPTAVATTTPTATTTTPAVTTTPTTSTASTSSSFAAFAVGQAVVINVDTLNFRASASINATVNSQLLDGTWATIVSGPTDAGDGHQWWQISVDGTTGWVDGSYLADAASDSAVLPIGTTAIVTSDTLNLRSDPSLSGTVQSTLANGDTGSVLADPQTADGYVWYQLDVNGVTGWATRDYLAFAPSDISSSAAGGTALVNTNVLVLRDSPTTSGAKLADLTGGASLTIVSGPTTADNLDWYEVSDGGTTGWVDGDYLRVV